MALALATASCITIVPPRATGGGSTVSQRTGVTCKQKEGVGHSCTNTTHTCMDLAADMLACCGNIESVSSATCNFATE